jgi:hypothetical protein
MPCGISVAVQQQAVSDCTVGSTAQLTTDDSDIQAINEMQVIACLNEGAAELQHVPSVLVYCCLIVCAC